MIVEFGIAGPPDAGKNVKIKRVLEDIGETIPEVYAERDKLKRLWAEAKALLAEYKDFEVRTFTLEAELAPYRAAEEEKRRLAALGFDVNLGALNLGPNYSIKRE